MRKIGLFGGAFNPIHNGHIEIAKAAMRQEGLDSIIFLPSGIAPHKVENAVNKEDRFIMAQKAIEDMSGFEISRYEIDKKEISYSIDTIKYFKEKFPEDDIYFIMGDDSYKDLPMWKDYKSILSICNVLVFPRIGIKIEKPAISIDMPRIPISSTQIREDIKNGKDASNMLPKPVLEYIIKNNLYLE